MSADFDPERKADNLSDRLDAEVDHLMQVLQSDQTWNVGKQKRRRWKSMLQGILCGILVVLAVGLIVKVFFS
jgi:formate/nitrite transporter FocA (FNT family)